MDDSGSVLTPHHYLIAGW